MCMLYYMFIALRKYLTPLKFLLMMYFHFRIYKKKKKVKMTMTLLPRVTAGNILESDLDSRMHWEEQVC